MELQAALSADPSQVAVARLLLRRYLNDWQGIESADSHDVPVLLVSELVTNAIRHARPPLELRAAALGSGVRVEVHDGTLAPPVLAPPMAPDALPAESGRGLHLVATLADRWGWDGHAAGKTVWFELDAL